MLRSRTLCVALLIGLLLAPAVAAKSTLSMEIAMAEKYSEPQEVVGFPARFTAMAPVRVTFENVRTEGDLQVPIPNPVTFAAGETKDVMFALYTPFHNGYTAETGKATYRATPSDGSAPLEWTLTVHTKGFYLPGAGLIGAVVALGVAAAFLRRHD